MRRSLIRISAGCATSDRCPGLRLDTFDEVIDRHALDQDRAADEGTGVR